MIRQWIFLVLATCWVSAFAGEYPIDDLAAKYVQNYGFLLQECKDNLYVYDLTIEKRDWHFTEAKPLRKGVRSLWVNVSEDWTSHGLMITHGGWEPAKCIDRVVFWWPNRPVNVIPTRTFVEEVLWPVLQECEESYFFGAGSDPEKRRLYDSVVVPACKERTLTFQDPMTNSVIVDRMRELYPGGRGPWGVYVEALYENIDFGHMY